MLTRPGVSQAAGAVQHDVGASSTDGSAGPGPTAVIRAVDDDVAAAYSVPGVVHGGDRRSPAITSGHRASPARAAASRTASRIFS